MRASFSSMRVGLLALALAVAFAASTPAEEKILVLVDSLDIESTHSAFFSYLENRL